MNEYVELMLNGKTISLITDAGTPCISDPGFLLVRESIKNGIKITCLPGPTALIPALVLSGLSSETFIFEGFLPRKKAGKQNLKRFQIIQLQQLSMNLRIELLKHYLTY